MPVSQTLLNYGHNQNMTRQVVLFLDQRKRGERKPRRSDACKRRANTRQHCTIILGVVISESLHCPMIALLFSSISQSLSQQVGIHKNPQKSSDPLLLHLQFLPPSTLSQCSHTDVGQLKTGKYLQRAVPAAHTKTFFLDPPTRLLLSPSLSPARQQSSRMCDNAAHHTPQCNHNSHSELET
jgi:hypothetical protein